MYDYQRGPQEGRTMSISNGTVSVVNRPDDVTYDALYQIINKAHEENRANGLKINTKISNGEQLQQHLGSKATTYVAFADGTIAGTVSVRMEEGQGVFTQGKQLAYLMHLAVLPEYKGCCVGRKLCEQVEKYAHEKGADAICLHVVNKNLARGFYTHIGYSHCLCSG